MDKIKKINTTNILMRITSVLLCLTILSIYLTTGLYARYTTNISENDDARVIDFGNVFIEESGTFETDGTMMIIPGVDLTKNAFVKFDGSESSTFVFVEVKTSSNWQRTNNDFFIKEGTKNLIIWSVASEWDYLKTDNNTHIFYRELEANTTMNSNIVANNGVLTVDRMITSTELSNMNGTYINFRAKVVQSNGFETPLLAWETINTNGQ